MLCINLFLQSSSLNHPYTIPVISADELIGPSVRVYCDVVVANNIVLYDNVKL